MQKKSTVHFLLEDMIVEVPSGTSLIKIVEQTNADITFGCRNGTCGTCRIQITEGLENLSPKNAEEKDFLSSINAQENERLGCQVCVHGNCQINYVG